MTQPNQSELTPEFLARMFHDTYELVAPRYDCVTRKETRQFDPTSPNGRTMITTCTGIIAYITANYTPINQPSTNTTPVTDGGGGSESTNQSELESDIEMLLLRVYNGEYDRSASQTLADVKKRIVSLINAHTNAEIAKVLKTILKSYPKKNRTMNDTSKLTRADIDRMITELKEVK